MAINPLFNESKVKAAIAAGDQHAFCTLFDHYQKYVFAFSLKLTRSEEIAEEVVQEIFMKIWDGRDKLKSIENFGAYLNRLVRNHSFNILRQEASHARANQKIGLSLSEGDDSTQQQLDYREISRILNEVIEHLPAQQKMVYTLCHQEGLKYEEAALKLNISASTVHYHMKLALSAIREHFKKNAGLYPVLLLYLFNKI